MKHELLRVNLHYTLEQMKWQTGKIPGKPTGLCHRVMLGALTGVEQDFTKPARNGYVQLDEERDAGLYRYPIAVYEMSYQDIAPAVLEESEPSGLAIDALVISGKAHNYDAKHVVAVVPTEGKPPYYIIDSLELGALKVARNTAEVQQHLEQRLDEHHPLSLSVVPNEYERERRTGQPLELQIVRIKDQIEIYAPLRMPAV